MTYQPATWKAAQTYLHQVTGLPWDGLGLQHFSPDGGGYHEGNDLLAAAGRLTSDYSKRESDRDRPGTDGSSAIDVGDFDVTINGRRLRLVEDFNPWLIAQCKAGAPDTLWIREVIYTLDRKSVRRWDRLNIRSTGDSSHLYHTHISGFRDEENTPKVPLFQRFFAEKTGAQRAATVGGGDDVGRQMLIKADNKLWLVDGMWRRPVPDAWWNNGTGPISDQQVHQAALLGAMGTPYNTGGDLDVWGIDIETRVASRVSAALAPIGDKLTHIDQLLTAAGGNVDNAPVLAAVAELRTTLSRVAHVAADAFDGTAPAG